ncbi:MAG: MarR family transcriptional regulator, partial [Alphaproteobacteria bacterium]
MSDNPPDADAPTASYSPRRGASLDSAANEAIELMFFAYRDFTDVADRILEQHDLGRAHHRALYFVGTGQDVTVGHLLDTLNITKQSLARVLRRLIDLGHERIAFVAGRFRASDRSRLRHQGYLTAMTGAGLEPLPVAEVEFLGDEAAFDRDL